MSLLIIHFFKLISFKQFFSEKWNLSPLKYNLYGLKINGGGGGISECLVFSDLISIIIFL